MPSAGPKFDEALHYVDRGKVGSETSNFIV